MRKQSQTQKSEIVPNPRPGRHLRGRLARAAKKQSHRNAERMSRDGDGRHAHAVRTSHGSAHRIAQTIVIAIRFGIMYGTTISPMPAKSGIGRDYFRFANRSTVVFIALTSFCVSFMFSSMNWRW